MTHDAPRTPPDAPRTPRAAGTPGAPGTPSGRRVLGVPPGPQGSPTAPKAWEVPPGGASPWEETIGFARAVAAGDRVLVAGTTSFKGSVLYGEGDPYEQTKVAFGTALEAIGAFGLDARSVVRTRMYLAHTRDVDEAGRAHREIFGAVRPAATLVVVSGFVDPRILVEIELEAFRDPSTASGDTEGPGAAPEAGAAPHGEAAS